MSQDEGRPPTQAEQSRARREQILDAAFHTFARRGYRDTAVDDIAAAAETSKGGVYFHFPTKEAIFRELMRTTADRLAAKVERAVAARDRPDRPGRGRAPHRARHVRRPPDDGPAAVPRRDGRRARLQGRDERAPRPVRAADRRATSTRRSRPARSRRSTRAITGIAWFGALNEVVARWLLTDDPGRLEDAYPTLRALLLRSVGVPEARIAAAAARTVR